MINEEKQASALEALLFVYGEALPFTKAATMLTISDAEVRSATEVLATKLSERGSGLSLLVTQDAVRLITDVREAPHVAALVAAETEGHLTMPTLEALAVIAYGGSTTKAEIDFVRGVNSAITLRTLLVRGLIIEHASAKYSIAPRFLEHLGVPRAEHLPEYDRLSARLALLRNGGANNYG